MAIIICSLLIGFDSLRIVYKLKKHKIKFKVEIVDKQLDKWKFNRIVINIVGASTFFIFAILSQIGLIPADLISLILLGILLFSLFILLLWNNKFYFHQFFVIENE